jgi:hypothetical protein
MWPRVRFAPMRRIIPILGLVVVAALARRSEAQPRPYNPPPPAPVWDSRGWVLLGERTVNGRIDHDTIPVGRYEGKFSKLTMVVMDSDLELVKFKIAFGDRTFYEPRVSHVFREGQRTRVIDMPPSEQVIRNIDIVYKNLPGDGRAARVQVWGFKTGDVAPPPPPPPPQPVWDSRGWEMLGERTVNGRVDRDVIPVGRYEGKFSKLTMVVMDSDLELMKLKVKFADRTSYEPRVAHVFREGQRTRVIDMPPSEQVIREIEMVYKNLPGDGRAARVQVWGFKTGVAAPPPPPRPVWDSTGWTKLGERTVNGRVDRDTIEVGRYEGRFSKITLVVENSDIELLELSMRLNRGEVFNPRVQHFFREGQRTRVIDLPGDDRVIKWIDLKYRNLRGGGEAKVEVWGFRTR